MSWKKNGSVFSMWRHETRVRWRMEVGREGRGEGWGWQREEDGLPKTDEPFAVGFEILTNLTLIICFLHIWHAKYPDKVLPSKNTFGRGHWAAGLNDLHSSASVHPRLRVSACLPFSLYFFVILTQGSRAACLPLRKSGDKAPCKIWQSNCTQWTSATSV